MVIAMTKVARKIKRIAHSVSPRHIAKRYSTARIISHFANKLGIVYFGHIDARSDEHSLLRGITVSNSHTDQHYTVGTFKTYDMALVIRRDSLQYDDKRLKDHFWTIMTFDLHTTYDVPHFYIAQNKIRDELLARYSKLHKISLGQLCPYPALFNENLEIYGNLEKAIEIEQIITPDFAGLIAQHCTDISIEVAENTVYLYIAEKHPSNALLERMTNLGIWFAQIIDQKSSQ